MSLGEASGVANFFFRAAGDDDFDIRRDFPQRGGRGAAVHEWHVEVGNYQIYGGGIFRETRDGRMSAGDGQNLITIIFQRGACDGENAFLVVYDKNSFASAGGQR